LSVAATLSESGTSDTATHGRGNRGGYGAYLRALEELAMSNAWVVDENRQLVTSGNAANRAYRYADLPIEADRLIQSVFAGRTVIGEDFSNLLKTPTITVGTPIYNNGVVTAALLLHTPLEVCRGNDRARHAAGVFIVCLRRCLLPSDCLSRYRSGLQNR
jgi:hypothetical protein